MLATKLLRNQAFEPGFISTLLFREVAERDAARRAETGEEEDEDGEQNWSELYSEEAAAIVIHHTSIMRNKRLLLAYQ